MAIDSFLRQKRKRQAAALRHAFVSLRTHFLTDTSFPAQVREKHKCIYTKRVSRDSGAPKADERET